MSIPNDAGRQAVDAVKILGDTLAALKVLGIEPPEFPGEPWSVILGENGPEEGRETAEETMRYYLDVDAEREAAERALSDALAFALGGLTDCEHDSGPHLRAHDALDRHDAARGK